MLVNSFGQQGWILQAMEACREACQNCIEMLSGTQAPRMNNQPLGQGGQYSHAARTAAELQASADQVAHQGTVSAARANQLALAGQADAALANGELDMFATLQNQAGLQDPASQGMPPSETKEASSAGSDGWIL